VAEIPTSAQAGTAADLGGDVAGIGPGEQLTALAASVLTHPRAVRGTDRRFHIAYELILTDSTALAVDVEQVEVRDARTQRVLLSLTGPDLLSRMFARPFPLACSQAFPPGAQGCLTG
jgi:hypothetical protein